MHPYFNGLIFGLVFIFSFGPGFFSLIQTSVQKGLGKSIFLVLGISLSDVLYVALALMGVSSLLQSPDVRSWIAIVGTIVLIGYAIYSWNKKPKIYEDTTVDKGIDSSYFMYLFKGFILNGLNPFILVFWIGIIGVVTVKYTYEFVERVYFLGGVLSTILTTDLLKAVIANRLRSVITPRSILIMNRSVAVILLAFSVRIILFLIDPQANASNFEFELPSF